MHITIQVPGMLRASAGGVSRLSVETPQSVRVLLDSLQASHPELYRSVCDETGTVRRHINLFVNSANVRDLEGLGTVLAPGDVVTILPAVSGG